jgi:hypothetical protein
MLNSQTGFVYSITDSKQILSRKKFSKKHTTRVWARRTKEIDFWRGFFFCFIDRLKELRVGFVRGFGDGGGIDWVG